MVITDIEQETSQLLNFISQKIPHSTYVSLLIFNSKKLIRSYNNNYNNWPQHYSKIDMARDSVFYEISHKKLEHSNITLCFWNSIPHTCEQSIAIDKKRQSFGLYNGITILESINNKITLGINITSDNKTHEKTFYAQVMLSKNILMRSLKEIFKKSVTA